MRLWHQYLIPYLDNKRLIGQHRECCALRGGGWGKKHATVDYVFTHHVSYLIQYHLLIMDECRCRGFKIDSKWSRLNYRGKNIPEFSSSEINNVIYWDNINTDTLCELVYPYEFEYLLTSYFIYPEHNPKYLLECINNLKSKNAELINGMNIDELKMKLELMGF